MFKRPTNTDTQTPKVPPTTAQSLKLDGQQSVSGFRKAAEGIWDMGSGATKACWHTYTGTLSGTFGYLSRHKNLAGAVTALVTTAHVALFNDNVSATLDSAKDSIEQSACDLLQRDLPFCDYDEIGALLQTMELDDPA